MFKATVGTRTFEIDSNKDIFYLNQSEYDFDIIHLSKNQYHIISNHKSYTAELVFVDKEKKIVELKINNSNYTVCLKDKMDVLLEKLGMNSNIEVKTDNLKAPMPGLILEIAVKKGDHISKGDKLLILEAMKMENVIKATGDGIVNEIKISVGDSVNNGQVLITFE